MITKTEFFKDMDLLDEKEFEFTGCDIRNKSIYKSTLENKVLPQSTVENIFKGEKEMPIRKAISFQDVSKLLNANNTYQIENLEDALNILIKEFKEVKNKYGSLIVVDIMSTESFVPICSEHSDLNKFRNLIKENRKDLITPSMLYAYAAIKVKCPFIEFTPNLSITPKAIQDFAIKNKVPICGKDTSTGQTLYKTTLANMFKKRNLKIIGWYSTNILGNRDGEILRYKEHKKTKTEDKHMPLNKTLGYNPIHVVNISYYPPKGDEKEAWDNIDFLGWFGLPMSMKIDWIGRDSILATPMLFDLLRLVDFANKRNEYGILDQLSVFFKNHLGSKEKSFLENYEKLINYAKRNSRN